MIGQLLALKRQTPSVSIKWVFITIIITLVLYLWKQQFFCGWVLIPFIFSVVSSYNYFNARIRAKKLQKIEEIKIDDIFWNCLQQHHPAIGLTQRRLIEQGFKDYLALHAMNKRAFAMPSNAVDMLWHAMLEFPERYAQLCHQALGRQLKHHPYTPSNAGESNDEKQKQLLESWRCSCMLHGFDPSNTTQLPRLFAIDQALNWPQGQIFQLSQIRADYKKYLSDQSSSSSCGGSSCSSCGGD